MECGIQFSTTLYLDLIDRHHQHPLKNFREVSEVEGVVRLGWSGEQLGGDGVVHGRGRANQLWNLIEEVNT